LQNVITFEEAIDRTNGSARSLLLGNGFSINHFNYANLFDAAGFTEESPVYGVFKALDTFDFERVMRALESGALVTSVYGENALTQSLHDDARRLREGLIHAIRETHPAHKEDISDSIPSCCRFLSSFGNVFTLNYDLLLYWAQLSAPGKFQDGFGLGEEKNGFRGPFQKHAYCNVFNLHGGLHLFENSRGEIEKRLDQGAGVIDAISETVLNEGRLPVYVAEGTSTAKVKRINSVSYLSHCFSKLQDLSGNLFVYGHSADENDRHIYAAIFRSVKAAQAREKNLEHLYFCVYEPSRNLDEIHGRLAKYKASVGSALKFTFVDAKSAKVWDGPGA